MKIYHNPRCSKSRQTLALIEEAGADVEVVEYLKNPLSQDDIKSLLDKLGKKPQEIIRKGEKIYKENYKGKEMNDQDWILAMAEHPILIERPIVEKGSKAVLGRPPENVKELL